MITVLLSTHNGARTLQAVLESYCRLVPPVGGWKLIVVDNASTDETRPMLDSFAGRLPLTVLNEARPGKNRALNSGLSHRAGDLVVITDDDAIATSNWLIEMQRAAALNPKFDLFGGAIIPRWERPPEPWLLEWVPHDMTYTLTPAGRSDGPIPATQVGGPNMAVRSKVFDEGHLFDETIGPVAGRSYTMGSETEFTLRMEQLGHRAYFASGAVVEHMIREFQMERTWILERAIRYGRCLYRRDRQRGIPMPRTFLGMPTWQLRRLMTRTISLRLARMRGNERQAFDDAWTVNFDIGYLDEARVSRQ